MKQTHKKHIFHLKRVGLFGFLMIAFFIVRLDAGSLPESIRPSYVLAYASEMSRSSLLAGTNTTRSAQGLTTLNSDAQLDSSAQAKAQDMATKDYWSHVSPDGTEPWYFFQQAGYGYSRAGENLAYGFSSSQGVIDGWSNSAAHRENMLGQYNDVGFGIVNVPNFQSGGQQTLVVAHYATRTQNTTTAVTTTPPTTPAVPPAVRAQATSKSVTQTETPAGSSLEPQTNTPATSSKNPTGTEIAVTVKSPPQKRISLISLIATRSLPIAAFMSFIILLIILFGYILLHRKAFNHAVATGENFVLTHPGVDIGVIAAATTLILMTTYGNIG